MKRIRFHDLRHSCASNLYANSVALKDIQEWLGHSDMVVAALEDCGICYSRTTKAT